MTGTIKALRQTFGFIAAEDGRDFFFNLNDLTDAFDVKVGDAVSFEAEVPQPEKGPRARGISFVAGGER
jgi:cold shock CspA family protein